MRAHPSITQFLQALRQQKKHHSKETPLPDSRAPNCTKKREGTDQKDNEQPDSLLSRLWLACLGSMYKLVKCTVGFLQMAGQMSGWVLTRRYVCEKVVQAVGLQSFHLSDAYKTTLIDSRALGEFKDLCKQSLSQTEHAYESRRLGWPVLKMCKGLHASHAAQALGFKPGGDACCDCNPSFTLLLSSTLNLSNETQQQMSSWKRQEASKFPFLATVCVFHAQHPRTCIKRSTPQRKVREDGLCMTVGVVW